MSKRKLSPEEKKQIAEEYYAELYGATTPNEIQSVLAPQEIKAAQVGAGQGFSYNFLPKVIAGASAPFGNESTGQNYQNILQGLLAEQEKVQQENPNAYFAGEIAGSLASPTPKGTNLSGRLASNAATGALAGAGRTYNGDIEDYLENTAEGGAVGYGLGALGEGISSGIKKGLGVTKENLKPFYKTNIEPTVGAVGNKFSKYLQNVSANTLGGFNKFDQVVDKTFKKIDDFVTGLSKKGSKLTREEGGELAEKGLRSLKENNQSKEKILREQLTKELPNKTEISMDKLVDKVNEFKKDLSPQMIKALENTPAGATIEKILKESEVKSDLIKGAHITKTLPYDRALDLKQEVGELAFSREFQNAGIGKEIRALRQLYGYLGEAIDEGATKLSPKAGKLLKEVNKLSSQNIQTNKAIEKSLSKAGKNLGMEREVSAYAPEKIMNEIVTENGIVNEKTLARASKGLNRTQRENLNGSVIYQLGLDPKNRFSQNKLADNFNKMEPKAQKVLLSAFDTETEKNFRNIIRTIDLNREVLKEGNSSKTALYEQFIKSLGLLGSGAAAGVYTSEEPISGAAKGAVAAFGTNVIASRLLTNPKFINWLAGTENKQGAALASQIAKLYEVAKSQPKLAADIKTYADFVKNNNDISDEQFEKLDATERDRYFYNKLNNLTDTELQDFVANSSDEEKAKIKRLLDQFEPK